MTQDELELDMRRLNLPTFAYSLGSDRDEAYCLTHEADGWHVYYSERGNRNSEEVFSTEAAACARLRERVLSDGAVRQWMSGHGNP
ncbi:hypothetical protein AFE02nite_02490 [Actinotalea fermentans]|uniref:Uncharacterized protein n=1 Tax=Actinotalea fermentans TaxID=43671 RepID=A0A511YTJ6_9CELL|nr:hypothetical protein AFE02nite_02490 [Actinotalea fermentans]